MVGGILIERKYPLPGFSKGKKQHGFRRNEAEANLRNPCCRKNRPLLCRLIRARESVIEP